MIPNSQVKEFPWKPTQQEHNDAERFTTLDMEILLQQLLESNVLKSRIFLISSSVVSLSIVYKIQILDVECVWVCIIRLTYVYIYIQFLA